MNTAHPAIVAARTAMNAVSAGDRVAWLACYADDAVLHDPVGGSPLDPEGSGVRGTTRWTGSGSRPSPPTRSASTSPRCTPQARR